MSLLALASIAIATLGSTRVLLAVAPRDASTQESHKRRQSPIPLVGGYLALSAILLTTLFGGLDVAREWPKPLALGLLVSVAVGMVDDLRKARGFPWALKLVGQVVAASSVFSVGSDVLPMPAWTVFFILLVAQNAWNLFDNFDGATSWLAVVVAAFVLALGGATGTATVIAGICIGFLPFNWPRARAYIGDAGAHALGFALAWVTILAFDGRWIAVLSLHAVPLLDMAQVLAVRLWLGRAPWRGDKRHLAHRLGGILPRAGVAPLLALLAASIAGIVFGVFAPNPA